MTDDPFKNGWCFCPKCAHLRSAEKPWKNPNCPVCGSTGKVAAEQVCPYRRCGMLREECVCPDESGYPRHNKAWIEATQKVVEERKEDAEKAEEFMQAMDKELRKKAKTQAVELPRTDRSATDILKDPPKLITKQIDLPPPRSPAEVFSDPSGFQVSNELQDAWFKLGEEAMRTKVIAFLEQRAEEATEAAKANKFIRREAMALSEAAELIKRGKEIPGGFEQ